MGKNNNITYGLGYQGSKNAIAWQIVNRLPSNDTLVDLFCGGGAITHCAMAPHDRFQTNYGRFKNYIMNDVNSLMVKAIKMAFNGEFKNETRWISKKEFKKLKDTDPYVAICFSFSNNLTTYMYNDKIEKYKKAIHYATMFNNWAYFCKLFSKKIYTESREFAEGLTDTQERRRRIMYVIKKHKVKVNTGKGLQNLQSLESLQRLQCLERLQSLQNIQYYSTDYRDVPIPPNSTVYCDIPYKGTADYKAVDSFDHDAFYEWALSRDFPVFVSEYNMPDTFTCLYKVKKNVLFSQQGKTGKKDEGLYVQNKFAKIYENPTKNKEVDMFAELEKEENKQ
jgi:hypothetical protein